MGRSLRDLLREESFLSQSEWGLHRGCRCVRRGGNWESLGYRMRFRRLRSRRSARLDGSELRGLRRLHRSGAVRKSVMRVEGSPGDVRPSRAAWSEKYSLPQPG